MIALGLLMMLTGAGGWGSPSVAMAQAVPQPSPRPALPGDDEGSSSKSSLGEMGHITGTVIDQTTGAPAPGVTVAVGDTLLTTDANGNYDAWLPTGSYTVVVVVDPARGTAAPPVAVELPPGVVTLQHLNYSSPQVAATPVPTAAAVAEPTAVPTAGTKARPIPTAEPAGSAPETTGPARLPRTGDDPMAAWAWLSLGMMLLMGGVLIGIRTDSMRAPALALATYARRSSTPAPAADAAALLAALLTTEMRATPRSASYAASGDNLLNALLDRDAQRRRAAQDVLAELLSKPVGRR